MKTSDQACVRNYNIGDMLAVIRLVHHPRFDPMWVEYHHPRLTRVYYNALQNMSMLGRKPFSVKELETMMFAWMQ